LNTTCFHLAAPFFGDLSPIIEFYERLGCQMGRKNNDVIIINFFSHQLVLHRSNKIEKAKSIYPRHFGLVLPSESDWNDLVSRAKSNQMNFYRDPYHRHSGQITEHKTFFLKDPSENLLEFKWYKHRKAIFEPIESASIGED
tara:strand:+ start:545 stop:970 length:426 start_codon:yes stop_codon:yes gene_type:complete